jgi:hypothetical protein
MALRLRNWKGLWLNLSAGALLCASVGCKTTGTETGLNLNAPKAMGPGNQVQSSPKSPAFNNLNGQGVVNGLPNGQMNNSNGMMQRNNGNPAMQGVQLSPSMNQVPNSQANLGQANQQMLLPTQFDQQGSAPNNVYAPPNQMQMPSNQIQMPPNYQQQAPNIQQQGQPNQLQLSPNYQQPPLINNQGPALPLNSQSSLDLHVPDSLPRNAPEAVRASDPALMPAAYNQTILTLDPAPAPQKDQPVRVIAGYSPSKKAGEPATVVTTTVEHQPVLEAPITPLRQ